MNTKIILICKKVITYLNKNHLFNSLLSLFYCGIILFFFFYQYHKVAILIIYIPMLIYVITNYNHLFFLIKKWWKILISFSVLFFFFSRIYTEKALSFKYDIQSEYLNYSITIYATLLAIILGILLICFIYFLIYTFKSIYLNLLRLFAVKYQEKTSVVISHFMPFIMASIFIAIIPLNYINNELRDYYIIADAYPVSDCGMKLKNIVYIRKNKAECYSIKLTIPPLFDTIKTEK